jgi:YihY family inner membrane protein
VETQVLGAQRGLDRFQARHPIVGFPHAVFKKYADDEGSRLAALLTYYGFLSIFPLAILFFAVLETVFRNNPELGEEFLSELLPREYAEAVAAAYQALPDSGPAFLVGIVGLLLAGTGAVFAVYATLNQVWAVPYRQRYGFGVRYARVFAMVVVLGMAAFVIGAVGVFGGQVRGVPELNTAVTFAATALTSFIVLLLAHWLLTARRLRFGEIALGCVLGGLLVAVVLTVGGPLLARAIAGATPVYGAFGAIVGSFSLVFLMAQAVVFGVEIACVRAWRLWPRGLDINLLFDADMRAMSLLAHLDERMPRSRNTPDFAAQGHDDPHRQPLSELVARPPGTPASPYHPR